MKDLQIIEKCQEGHMEHFGKLYNEYVDMIYKFIFLKTFDKEIAEDLTSEVFYNTINKIDSFDTESQGSVKAWIYTIAHNKVKDYYKMKKQNVSIEEYLEKSTEIDMGKNLDNKEQLHKVLKYLKTLKPDQKEIMLLRIWEDLSYKDIAEITGKTVANCKQIVSRNLKTISANFILILMIIILL